MTTTVTEPLTGERQAARQFEAATREHRMTVLHDHAPAEPYRHLRFARPGTGVWRFDLVTWPGHLAITGDVQAFTFARLHDMVLFFHHDRINPGYWAEKVIAGRTHAPFTFELYEQNVRGYVDDYTPDWDRADVTALRADVDRHLFGAMAPYSVESAQELLQDYRFAIKDEDGTVRHSFDFVDTWEWDLRGLDHHFLLACHAVRWGVRTYLEAGGKVAAGG